MRSLDHLEIFLQRVFERPGKLLLSRKLHPLELAAAIERYMEDHLTPMVGRPTVPNVFTVHIHPEDFQTFAPVRRALEQDLVDRVAEVVQGRGYRLLGPITVSIEADDSVARGESAVSGQIAEANVAARPPAPPPPPVTNPTRPLETSSAPGETRLRLSYTGADGTATVWPLGDGPCTIGRAADNDIQLHDLRVSRHHARIEPRSGTLYIIDLASSNGTTVNGRPIQAEPIAPGDEIGLGGLILRLETGQ
jgi:hypothetical protein